MSRSEADRFAAKTRVLSNGCIEWTGYRNPGSGYGRFWFDGRLGYAHRWAYAAQFGPIPDGLHIDHLCRHAWCVNPDHLDCVTQPENNLRTHQSRVERGQTTNHDRCPQGHLLDAENVYRDQRGASSCRTCKDERRRAWGRQPWTCPNCGQRLTKNGRNRHMKRHQEWEEQV